MPEEHLFRGELYCTPCSRDDSQFKRQTGKLVRMSDGSYEGRCWTHKQQDGEDLAMVKECFHYPWRDVVKITLHKVDQKAYDRKGPIITIEMRNVPNTDYMRQQAVEVAHGLQLMADKRATVHDLGHTGEGNYCWTETNYHWKSPATCTIIDKYWGDDQINVFYDLCRFMCGIHKWELVDETMPLLDRIALALNDADKKDSTG